MRKFNIYVYVIMLLSSAVVLFAGGQGESKGSKLKVALVTDVGGVNDQSFNQSAWEGLTRAKRDLGITVSYVESTQDADYIPNLQTLVDAKNDLIWGIGFKMGDAIAQMARLNPDQRFAIVDFSYGDKTPANVVGVLFRAEEPSFLVGYIAGKMTKTKKVGFVGGISGFIIDAFDYGYHAGVYYANKNVMVLRQYADSFVDAAKGKSIALQMYVQGADIIFHAAGAVGNGVIEASREQGMWSIGVDRDQNDLAPDNVLTSAMKKVGDAIYLVAKELNNGVWKGGSTLNLGLVDGAVGIAPSSDQHVPADILNEVVEISTKIINGDIKVPNNQSMFEQFVSQQK